MRALRTASVLLLLCALPARAADEPETIGGRDRVWWSTQALEHGREIERLEEKLSDCEEREAPPAYRNVPGQVYRGRDGIRYREVVRCDGLREELAAARDRLDELEDLARQLGVPPGWLRSRCERRYSRAMPRLGWQAVLLSLALAGAAAAGDRGAFPLEDRLQLIVQSKSLLAIDAETGGQREVSLELGERVLAQGSDGRVGFAITDRRILAIAAGSAAFQQARFARGEALAAPAALGDRVALFVTSRRVLGFDGGSGNLVETRLGPRESVARTAVANSVAVAATTRRALGLSPFRGGFFEVPLDLAEGAPTLVATGEVATLRTGQRILTFRAATGSWEERRVGLGD